MNSRLARNLGLDLVRVTEAAALSAGRWMGVGQYEQADQAAGSAMVAALNDLDICGTIAIGEEGRLHKHLPIETGCHVGASDGPPMDIVADPIEGRYLLGRGRPNAISVAAIAPSGTMWAPAPALYMEKIVVNREAASALVPECMDAPAAWTLALVARAKNVPVRDLVVFVLDRTRHRHLVEEIRSSGARVMLRSDGDVAGALLAATIGKGVDILMGIGGIPEGVLAACAVKALRGGMLGRLAPQTEEEQNAVQEAGLDIRQVLACDDLIAGDQVFFAATGITNGDLLSGARYYGERAETQSMVLRSETGTCRMIRAEHLIGSEPDH